MIEALLFIGTGTVLVFGSASLVIATLALRNAHRYVEIAELRMERLSEGQARLLTLLGEGRVPEETSDQRGGSAEERERRTRRDAERRIEHLERELREFRGVRRESSLPVLAGSVEDRMEVRGLTGEELPATRETETTPRPAEFPETTTRRKPTVARPGDGRPSLGALVPHPDDGVELVAARTVQARARSGAPVEMFRKHYDKYLENYRGYVELAEGLYRMRDAGEVPSGPAECEWEEKLRRVEGGIKRTTARLDILEGHNTELVADNERVSRRASVARRYLEIQRNRRGL